MIVLHSSGPCWQGGWLEAHHSREYIYHSYLLSPQTRASVPRGWLFRVRQHTSGHVSFKTLIRRLGRATLLQVHQSLCDPSSQGKGQGARSGARKAGAGPHVPRLKRVDGAVVRK